jgi:hypothetical protein
VEPFAYLRDLLTRLPTLTNWQIKDVTRGKKSGAWGERLFNRWLMIRSV